MDTKVVNIPLSAMNLWFWMLEESDSKILSEQSQNILLALFDTLEQARAYRIELEAQQFSLKNLCADLDEESKKNVYQLTWELAS